MKNRLVQFALSLAFLGLLIQVVLVAPIQIHDAGLNAAVAPMPEVHVSESNKGHLAIEGEQDVDQSMKGMHMIETHEGRKEWELWADKAISQKTKNSLQMDNVKAIFFSDSGVTFTVTGAKGLVHIKSRNLKVNGDVITRSSNGYVFRTDSVDYNSETRLLSAVNAVEMLGPRDVQGHTLHLRGNGMNASLETSKIEILSDVKAERTLKGERKAYIKSQRSIFSGKSNAAKFLGEVVLDLDSMRITGPEASFAYDGKSDLVKTVNFSGGARVSDPSKWATAQNVDVDFEANRFVFRGNPRVVQNNDELRGQEIIFIDGGKQVQVKGARAMVDERRMTTKPSDKGSWP